jgi:hypothetical protein
VCGCVGAALQICASTGPCGPCASGGYCAANGVCALCAECETCYDVLATDPTNESCLQCAQ